MSKKSGMKDNGKAFVQKTTEKGVERSKTTRKKTSGKEKKQKRQTAKQSRKANR